jgi:NAD(P)-dependent dehydrogenase (short-subunit alcohol dehydrogenase family)
MLLRDKVVMVTGVGPGMGRKLALIGAAEGAKIAVAARSKGFVEEVAQEISTQGGQAIAVPTDVTDSAQCERLVAATCDAFGRVDGLINSAYVFGGGQPLETHGLDQWTSNMDVTFFGAMRMIAAVVPVMKQQRDGAIVNVSTRSVVQPIAGEGGYVAAKSALHGATRQLAAELGPFNIRVNAPRMGWLWGIPVQNHLRHMALAQGVPEQQLIDRITSTIPLGVIPPDEECAKSVLFFVSDYARMVTGTSLDINGGQYIAA